MFQLISQVRLDRRGIGVTLADGHVVLFRAGDKTPLLVHGDVHNDMYRLDMSLLSPPVLSRETEPSVNAIHSAGFYTA
jgi:hypothetical protein